MGRSKLFLIPAFLILSALYYIKYQAHKQDSQRLAAAQKLISSLNDALNNNRDEIEKLRRVLAALDSSAYVRAPVGDVGGVSAIKPPVPLKEQGKEGGEAKDKPIPEWMVSARLDQVSQLITLSEDERDALKNLAQTKLKGGVSNAQAIEDLEQIIGYERTFELMQKFRESDEQFRRQIIDDQVFAMGRRLGLSLTQEEQVRSAVEEVQAELESRPGIKPEATDANGNRKSPVVIMSELREEKIALLNSKLRPLLTDEQFNGVLEYQRVDAMRRFP